MTFSAEAVVLHAAIEGDVSSVDDRLRQFTQSELIDLVKAIALVDECIERERARRYYSPASATHGASGR